MNRRDLIVRSFFFSLGAYLSRPRLLSAQTDEEKKAPFILLIHCDGGWDQHMVFDNKKGVAGASYEEEASLKKAATGISFIDHPDRSYTSAFFETYGDKALVLNGLYCPSLSHEQALLQSIAAYHQKSGKYIDWLAFYCSQTASEKVMPYVVIDSFFVGQEQTSITTYLDDKILKKYQTPVLTGDKALSKEEQDLLTEYLDWGYNRLENQLKNSTDKNKFKSFYSSFIKDKQVEVIAKDLSASSTSEDDLFRQGKIALNLFKEGHSQCVSLRSGKKLAWDSHEKNFSVQTKNFEYLFKNLSLIVQEAHSLDIEKKLVILVKSELGRHPKLNEKKGKNHWPYTSALLWSPIVKGGQVLGKTTNTFIGEPINPIFGSYDSSQKQELLTLAHVYAGLYEYAGISKGLVNPIISPALFMFKT